MCVAHSYLETHVAASDTSRLLPAGTKKDDQTQDTGGETQGAFSYKITKAPSGIGRCNTLVCESSLRPVGVVGCQANPTNAHSPTVYVPDAKASRNASPAHRLGDRPLGRAITKIFFPFFTKTVHTESSAIDTLNSVHRWKLARVSEIWHVQL